MLFLLLTFVSIIVNAMSMAMDLPGSDIIQAKLSILESKPSQGSILPLNSTLQLALNYTPGKYPYYASSPTSLWINQVSVSLAPFNTSKTFFWPDRASTSDKIKVSIRDLVPQSVFDNLLKSDVSSVPLTLSFDMVNTDGVGGATDPGLPPDPLSFTLFVQAAPSSSSNSPNIVVIESMATLPLPSVLMLLGVLLFHAI